MTDTAILAGAALLQLAALFVIYMLFRRLSARTDRMAGTLEQARRADTEALRGELATLAAAQRAALQGLARPREPRQGQAEAAPAKVADAARKAVMTTGQQIEWHAHLCHLLKLPFGALPATRHWAASPDLLVHLAEAILDRGPQSVVECGSGLSTLVAARALQIASGGMVHSLEADPAFARLTRARLARLGLSDHAHVIDAPIEALPDPDGRGWYRLSALGALPERTDLIFVDGPQASGATSRAPALDHLFERLAPGGAVLIDDARRTDCEALRKAIRQRHGGWAQRRLPAEKGALMFERPASRQALRAAE